MQDEMLEIVDEKGNVVGLAPRSRLHGDPSLMHRVVHVMVFNRKGELLLQLRSMNKDVAPGKWDTSAGGHVSPGEEVLDAAKRELKEELGVSLEPEFLYSYTHTNPYETELVYTFSCTYDGGFSFDKEEIDGIRFWGMDELGATMGRGLLSDNFEHELKVYLAGGS